MGKSSLVRALGAARDVEVETVLGTLSDPTDFTGWPIRTDEGVRQEPRAWAKRLIAAGEGLLFLDELTTCAPSVQSAMLAVTLDKMVGDVRLPDDVWVIAGANPPDQAAGGYDLEPPLANRLCHLEFEPTNDEWLEGMMTGWSAMPVSRAVARTSVRDASVIAEVTGFIQRRPDLLHNYPESVSEAGGAWPSQRTWAMVTKVLAHLRADDLAAIQAAVFGLVGQIAGRVFLTWLNEQDLPDPLQVMRDPSIVKWAQERPDRVWAILNGVVTLAVQAGTQDQWRRGWKPLAACADAGVADVAAASARTLAKARPHEAKPPASARRFMPILVAAGLMSEEDAA